MRLGNKGRVVVLAALDHTEPGINPDTGCGKEIGTRKDCGQRAILTSDRDSELGQPFEQVYTGRVFIQSLRANHGYTALVDHTSLVCLAGPMDVSVELTSMRGVSLGTSGWDGSATAGDDKLTWTPIAWKFIVPAFSAVVGFPARRLSQVSSRSAANRLVERSSARQRFNGKSYPLRLQMTDTKGL